MKLQFNAEENWTKALKFLLINLKFIVGWVSLHQDMYNKDLYNVGTDIDEASLAEEFTDDDWYEMIEAPPPDGSSVPVSGTATPDLEENTT